MPVTIQHRRYRLALLFLRPCRPAILFLPLLLLLISSVELRSQTQSSAPIPVVATERKVQPKIVVSEQTVWLAEASPDKAIVANPNLGSSGPSFLKRVVLFPLRLVRAIAGSFGEGRKSVASSSGGSGEVVDSKIYGDEAGAKLPDETANAVVSSGDHADGTTWKLEDDSEGGAEDLPINAVAVVNADEKQTMGSRDQFIRVLRFEVDGKPVRKSFRVSLFDNDKFVDLKTVKDGFLLPAKFTKHEFVRIRFRIGSYDLLFDPIYRAKFETEWIIGVDRKPFDPDNVFVFSAEQAKKTDIVHYIDFEPKSGDGTKLIVMVRNVPRKVKHYSIRRRQTNRHHR